MSHWDYANSTPTSPWRGMFSIGVDACSVEVFADGGRTVISDLIFPDPESRGVELYSRGGEATVGSLDVFGL